MIVTGGLIRYRQRANGTVTVQERFTVVEIAPEVALEGDKKTDYFDLAPLECLLLAGWNC